MGRQMSDTDRKGSGVEKKLNPKLQDLETELLFQKARPKADPTYIKELEDEIKALRANSNEVLYEKAQTVRGFQVRASRS